MNVCGVIALGFGFLLVFPSPSCSNSDNMGFLLGTLKLMQRASCDDDEVALACPATTTISIQVAQYGKASNNYMCDTGLPIVEDDENCLWPNTMQYSLLQTVVEACQKKPECKFSTKPRPGLEDPCPHTRKFVDVAYKCRPYEFRSRTCCQDDHIKLSCKPYSRVAIFDALYGRNAYEPITCHQTGMHNETCIAPHTLDTVMQICHGKRRCLIEASDRVFGAPCNSSTRTYLKVIYACVPLGVLKPKHESKLQEDEIPNGKNKMKTDNDNFFDETEWAGERWEQINPALPMPEEPTVATTTKASAEVTTQKNRKESDIGPGSSQTQIKQKIFIYMGIGILILIILVAALFGFRYYYYVRRTSEHSKNGDMFTTEPPNVFSDGASDIDNDIDVSHISGTFYDPVHPDMILYRDCPGNKGSIRAMRPLSTIYPCSGVSMYGNEYVPPPRVIQPLIEEDEGRVRSPKSLGTYSNSQLYYG
ncbi:protein eva-1-like isoform X2 [Ostrinia furnacalis]|uniref:protein eva-1-like isoform X2 n=1 Tax=Ostrinia furnacalis TaxID=93504 RepID=UPI001038E0DA|nr:protein eva-1-like isoform X2 [Ostrinia furnacalis]